MIGALELDVADEPLNDHLFCTMKLRLVLSGIAIACLFPPARLSAEALPVEAFAALPSVQSARISPDGKRVAALVNSKGVSMITTVQIGSKEPMKPVISTDNKKFRISWYNWANDDKLLVSMRYPHQIVGTDTVETDLYSVRHDGSELQNMVDTRRSKWVPQFCDRVIDYLEDDPEHVLMALDLDQPAVMDLYKVNVNTARRSRVLRGRENVVAWMTDRQQRVRAMVTLLDGKYGIQVREVEGRQWRTLWEYEAFTPDVITPMGFDWDPNILYARGYHDGRFAVFKVDLEDAELTKQLMHSNPKYDVEGSLIYSTHQKKVLGIRDARHSGGYVIWERNYEPVLRNVAMRLPFTRNLLVDTSRDESRFILIATNDTHPGTFYYGDRKTSELTGFARRYPQLRPEVLAKKKKVQYVATDGQRIDGYLTLPRDAEPGVKLPTIIHPHGGPAQRTQQGFDH